MFVLFLCFFPQASIAPSRGKKDESISRDDLLDGIMDGTTEKSMRVVVNGDLSLALITQRMTFFVNSCLQDAHPATRALTGLNRDQLTKLLDACEGTNGDAKTIVLRNCIFRAELSSLTLREKTLKDTRDAMFDICVYMTSKQHAGQDGRVNWRDFKVIVDEKRSTLDREAGAAAAMAGAAVPMVV